MNKNDFWWKISLSETICHFCSCALFSNIYCKINFVAKNGSDLCNFCIKLDFWNLFIKKYFSAFLNWFLAHLYESTERAIALPLASELALASGSAAAALAALTKMLKFYVKVFKTSYFLNPLMDLVYIWYNYRCWSKILLSHIHTPAHDL